MIADRNSRLPGSGSPETRIADAPHRRLIPGVRAASPLRVECPQASTPYRDSFLYNVDGSMPSTSAARVLLPPSLCSTQRM